MIEFYKFANESPFTTIILICIAYNFVATFMRFLVALRWKSSAEFFVKEDDKKDNQNDDW